MVGIVSAKLERLEEAIGALTDVVNEAPETYLAYYWLASALRRQGKLDDAVAMTQKAIALNPNEPQAYHQLGLCYIDLQDWEAAEIHLQKAAKLAPDVATTQFGLGYAREELGRTPDARRAYRRALALNPNYVNALNQMGHSMIHELNYASAREYAERILKAEPDSLRGHALMAASLVGLSEAEAAQKHADKVLQAEPDKPDVLTLYGSILQSLGQMEEGERCFRQAIETDPKQAYAYYGLFRTRKVTSEDAPMIEQMEEGLTEPRLRRDCRRDLEFALGKAYSDLGDPQSAMRHYDAGNAVMREMKFGQAEFNQEHYKRSVDFAMRIMDRTFLEKYREEGSPDRLPVWILGMMRSGTTLAEQILSSHPDIVGAGEQRFWMENREKALLPPGNVVDVGRMRELSASYIDLLRGFGPQASRVTDKLPANYMHMGIMHIAFPNAKFIHVRRHPVNTCLSIWTTLNSATIDWGNVKRNIVCAYREYLRIMQHWREVLPPGVMLEVNYEDLVADPNPWIRKMVAFCGVEWDDRCLRPEDNRRAVATPSDWQVRQPIYKTSVERWRPFEPYLGEFKELLHLAPQP